MKKITTLSALIVAALALPSVTYSATFGDDFSTDTSAAYVATKTYPSLGTHTAWDIAGGTLNTPTSGGNNQVLNVFYGTAIFAIGETVSVDISGPDDTYLSVSTTTRAANTAGDDGVRLNWRSNGTFRARSYTGGVKTELDFHSSFIVASGSSLTLYLTRETDNTFSAAYSSSIGGTIEQLNTTGGSEKQTFSAGVTGQGDLFIGVETYNGGVRNFDNLAVVPEPASAALLLGLGGLALAFRRRR
jgi:hypothetical protein